MRHIAGTIGGFCSGFLVYMAAAMIFYDLSSKASTPSPAFVMITFLGAWALTHFAIVNGTKGFAKPMARAFFIGSAEWMVMVLVGVIVSGKLVSSGGNSAGSALGGGILAMITGGMSIGMSIFCAVGFFLFHFIGREGATAMAPDQETKKCLDCAELVNVGARKCKHCGYIFSGEGSSSAAG